jgi:hypothetical protein
VSAGYHRAIISSQKKTSLGLASEVSSFGQSGEVGRPSGIRGGISEDSLLRNKLGERRSGQGPKAVYRFQKPFKAAGRILLRTSRVANDSAHTEEFVGHAVVDLVIYFATRLFQALSELLAFPSVADRSPRVRWSLRAVGTSRTLLN